MTDEASKTEHRIAVLADAGAQYSIYGTARRGGAYNSHVVFALMLIGLAMQQRLHYGIATWVAGCLTLAIMTDERSWRRKVCITAIPGQLWLYLQVVCQAFLDAAPQFLTAFAVYVLVAPVWKQYDVSISSFVMLYAFFMGVRLLRLVHYLILLIFRWDQANSGPFVVHEGNLTTPASAFRHLIWSYSLGNIGLIVRSGTQVLTLLVFESIRQGLDLDLTHSGYRDHIWQFAIIGTAVWLAMIGPAISKALLVFYRTHRTLHASLPLYDCIHAIHHRGVFPTKLDAGTESPLELSITEMVAPLATPVPNWLWTTGQVLIDLLAHEPGHDTGSRRKYRHHIYHHHFFNVNFGLIPAHDRRFGTLYRPSDSSSLSEDSGHEP